VVTNVAAFGAFVDVGVHQDGLVHVSELADHFVKDPHAVVKVGDKITVRVLSVDLERRRISLSAKRGKAARAAEPPAAGAKSKTHGAPPADRRPAQGQGGQRPGRAASAPDGARFQNNPFAGLLKKS